MNFANKWDREEQQNEDNNAFIPKNPENSIMQKFPKYLKMISSCSTCFSPCDKKQEDGVCYLYMDSKDKKFYRASGWLHS